MKKKLCNNTFRKETSKVFPQGLRITPVQEEEGGGAMKTPPWGAPLEVLMPKWHWR